jgi:Rrf2 family transcriptional repressor of oqxAB
MSPRAQIHQIGPPRFRTAVHVLVWLAKSQCVLSSAAMACQVHSHATFLRRVLASLVQAGMVESREGRDGGYSLKLPPEQISLADIYIAVRSEGVESEDQVDCGEEGVQLDRALEAIVKKAEKQTIDYLRQYTIADLVGQLNLART